jgi:NADH-quinone oxidoreductase subunit N
MFGHYIKDAMGDLLKLFIIWPPPPVFLYSRDYLRSAICSRASTYVLGLFGVLGMMIMVSAHSLLSVYLGLELLSLSLYALVAMDRDSPVGFRSRHEVLSCWVRWRPVCCCTESR